MKIGFNGSDVALGDNRGYFVLYEERDLNTKPELNVLKVIRINDYLRTVHFRQDEEFEKLYALPNEVLSLLTKEESTKLLKFYDVFQFDVDHLSESHTLEQHIDVTGKLLYELIQQLDLIGKTAIVADRHHVYTQYEYPNVTDERKVYLAPTSGRALTVWSILSSLFIPLWSMQCDQRLQMLGRSFIHSVSLQTLKYVMSDPFFESTMVRLGVYIGQIAQVVMLQPRFTKPEHFVMKVIYDKVFGEIMIKHLPVLRLKEADSNIIAVVNVMVKNAMMREMRPYLIPMDERPTQE
jgi:hypothetical protein